MKKVIFLFSLQIVMLQLCIAQIPKIMSYQAVLTNKDGTAYKDKNVSFRFSIQRIGADVFVEQHDNVRTSPLGQVNLNIGQGNRLSGDINAIDWSDGSYSVRTDIRLEGNSFFELYSNTDFKSVPFALQAEKAKNGINKMVFQSNDNRLIINDNFSVDLSSLKSDADADPSNEIQTITKSGSDINLSKGGGTVSVNDADADPSNEIQTITKSGNDIILSKGGGTVSNNDADADPSNEIQKLSFNSTTSRLTLDKNGNEVDLSPLKSGSTVWQLNGLNTFYNAGNVGIGTINPTRTLEVVSSNAAKLGIVDKIGSTNSTIEISPTEIETMSNPDKLFLQKTGNILIGNDPNSSNITSKVNIYNSGNASTALSVKGFSSDKNYPAAVIQSGVYGNSNLRLAESILEGGGSSAIDLTSRTIYNSGSHPDKTIILQPRNKTQGNIGIGIQEGFSAATLLHLQSSKIDWQGGLMLENVSTTSGRKFVLASRTDGGWSGGAFVISDETGRAARFTIAANGTAYFGDLTTNTANLNNVYGKGFITSSDRRLKTNIRNIENSISKLEQLNGVHYTWIADQTKDMGVIAQEVETVFPELVHTLENGTKTVNYNGLIPVLIEAIKEQQSQINSLKANVSSLTQEKNLTAETKK
jgi:hypothetical protein